MWSLGVILYRMATNKFPFDAANLAQLALKITAGSFPPLSPNYSPQAHHLVALLLQIVPEPREPNPNPNPNPNPDPDPDPNLDPNPDPNPKFSSTPLLGVPTG